MSDKRDGVFLYHTSCISCDSSDGMAVYEKEDENEIGIVFKYIDIFECNENKGQSKYYLQND